VLAADSKLLTVLKRYKISIGSDANR
jgi:hypothetical protein